jgi:hypothetical protein
LSGGIWSGGGGEIYEMMRERVNALFRGVLEMSGGNLVFVSLATWNVE